MNCPSRIPTGRLARFRQALDGAHKTSTKRPQCTLAAAETPPCDFEARPTSEIRVFRVYATRAWRERVRRRVAIFGGREKEDPVTRHDCSTESGGSILGSCISKRSFVARTGCCMCTFVAVQGGRNGKGTVTGTGTPCVRICHVSACSLLIVLAYWPTPTRGDKQPNYWFGFVPTGAGSYCT